MEIESLESWKVGLHKPAIIAGPCSVETEEQLLETSQRIKEVGIEVIRAGIWKPRTRLNNFEELGK